MFPIQCSGEYDTCGFFPHDLGICVSEGRLGSIMCLCVGACLEKCLPYICLGRPCLVCMFGHCGRSFVYSEHAGKFCVFLFLVVRGRVCTLVCRGQV